MLAIDRLVELGGVPAAITPAIREKLDAVLPRTWSGSNPVDIVGDADAVLAPFNTRSNRLGYVSCHSTKQCAISDGDESGFADPTKEHKKLFFQFGRALGLSPEDVEQARPVPELQAFIGWRDRVFYDAPWLEAIVVQSFVFEGQHQTLTLPHLEFTDAVNS